MIQLIYFVVSWLCLSMALLTVNIGSDNRWWGSEIAHKSITLSEMNVVFLVIRMSYRVKMKNGWSGTHLIEHLLYMAWVISTVWSKTVINLVNVPLAILLFFQVARGLSLSHLHAHAYTHTHAHTPLYSTPTYIYTDKHRCIRTCANAQAPIHTKFMWSWIKHNDSCVKLHL